MNLADAYTQFAVSVIETCGSEADLRDWWKREEDHRTEYGLLPVHVNALIAYCRIQMQAIQRGQENVDLEQPADPRPV